MRRPVPNRRLALRLGWGTLLLAAPAVALRLLGGTPTPDARTIARVLGARHVVQAAFERWDDGRHRYLLAAVDWAHAASGVAFASVDRRWRRPALTDAALAAVLGWWTARTLVGGDG
ncbi:MAG: hypothetical protein ACRDYZ_05445 [Acidimicrobiales bacterium]